MPAPRMMLKSTDIAAYTGMSVQDARYLIRKFEHDGKIRLGRKRNKLVDIKIFADWYAEMYDRDAYDVRNDIKQWMKECAAEGSV